MDDTSPHRVWFQKREVTRTREYIHRHARAATRGAASRKQPAGCRQKHVACVSHVTRQSVTSQCHSQPIGSCARLPAAQRLQPDRVGNEADAAASAAAAAAAADSALSKNQPSQPKIEVVFSPQHPTAVPPSPSPSICSMLRCDIPLPRTSLSSTPSPSHAAAA